VGLVKVGQYTPSMAILLDMDIVVTPNQGSIWHPNAVGVGVVALNKEEQKGEKIWIYQKK